MIKRHLLFLLPFLIFQNNIASQSVISSDKMNVLFAGLDNPLSIAVEGISMKEVQVTASQGVIKRSNDNYYVISNLTVGEVLIMLDHKGKTLQTHKFRVKKIPDPDVRLPCAMSNCKGGRIDIGTLKAMDRIVAMMTGFDIDGTCAVISYDVTFMPKNGTSFTLSNLGQHILTKSTLRFKRATQKISYILKKSK